MTIPKRGPAPRPRAARSRVDRHGRGAPRPRHWRRDAAARRARQRIVSPGLGAGGSPVGRARRSRGRRPRPLAIFTCKRRGLSVATAKARRRPGARPQRRRLVRQRDGHDRRRAGGRRPLPASGQGAAGGRGPRPRGQRPAPLSLANLVCASAAPDHGDATIDAKVGGTLGRAAARRAAWPSPAARSSIPDSGTKLSGSPAWRASPAIALTIERLPATTQGEAGLSGSTAVSGDIAADLTLACAAPSVSDGEALVAVLSRRHDRSRPGDAPADDRRPLTA